MKIWNVWYTSEDGCFRAWFANKRDASEFVATRKREAREQAGAEWDERYAGGDSVYGGDGGRAGYIKEQTPDIKAEIIFVPTSKAGLVAWLNQWASADNG